MKNNGEENGGNVDIKPKMCKKFKEENGNSEQKNGQKNYPFRWLIFRAKTVKKYSGFLSETDTEKMKKQNDLR